MCLDERGQQRRDVSETEAGADSSQASESERERQANLDRFFVQRQMLINAALAIDFPFGEYCNHGQEKGQNTSVTRRTLCFTTFLSC